MLRYKTQTRKGLVALYDIQPGNRAGLLLQPWSPHRTHKQHKITMQKVALVNSTTDTLGKNLG